MCSAVDFDKMETELREASEQLNDVLQDLADLIAACDDETRPDGSGCFETASNRREMFAKYLEAIGSLRCAQNHVFEAQRLVPIRSLRGQHAA